MKFDENIDYPNGTIGYHWKMSRVAFGEDSAPTKWLELKAGQSPKNMHQDIVMHESQVLNMLGHMFVKEREMKEQDEDDGYKSS